MAKTFVKISLATKLRLLFGASVLGTIVAALVVPWYFVELQAEHRVQQPGAEITRLRLNEWILRHEKDIAAASQIEAFYSYSPDGPLPDRAGPRIIRLSQRARQGAAMEEDELIDDVAAAFASNSSQDVMIRKDEDSHGRGVFRCFRAIRIESDCMSCHNPSAQDPGLRHQAGELVGLVDMTLPRGAGDGPLMWPTRLAFVLGGTLAGLLAFVLFANLTRRLVLRPIRQLSDVADKVALGDLSIRSGLKTDDELQHLGESFNSMLASISNQHSKLQAANRALDLKLNELGEANVALFEANRIKNEFLANVSHELRTPLNSIIGFADLLADAEDERVRRYAHNISSSAKHLMSMINDLLDLAKIEAGKTIMQFDRVSVIDTCQTLIALTKPMADKKELTIREELSDDVPIIMTDGSRLQQILYNLLSNAIKFTPAGGEVTVRAHAHGNEDTSEVKWVSVTVIDNGPGISEGDQKHIFEKFYQADRTLTKESQGAGLGLAIAKELTDLLGGKISLESSPGHGAAFTVALPVESPVQHEDTPLEDSGNVAEGEQASQPL